MKRRDFLRSTMMATGAVMSPVLLSAVAKKQAKPNILFLFADDMCHEALSAFGSEVQTPNLDKLVKNGVTFTNTYNQGGWNGAVCIASRTMLNTGRFVWKAKEKWEKKEMEKEVKEGRIWSLYLNKAGYDTYMTGKWHIQHLNTGEIFGKSTHIRPGMPKDHYDWENIMAKHVGYFRPVEGEKDNWSPYDKSMGGFWEGGKHWSEVLADDSIDFFKDASKSDKPFFMYLAFNAPHDPRQSPKKYVDKYPVEDVKVPENFIPLYPDKDAIGCGMDLRDAALAPFPRTEYSVKVNRQEYYAIISHMDDQIGRILHALKKSGKMDNTYIIFTADHGLACGHHGLIGKQNMYEHSMCPPLVVTGPTIPKNKTNDAFVYLQDVMPTTLELAGIDKPDHVQFNSLLPLISGGKEKNYNSVYGCYIDLQRMVRRGNFKLIYYPKINKYKLFNLKKDPHEMNDLAGNEKYKKKINNLKKELKRLQKQTGDELVIS